MEQSNSNKAYYLDMWTEMLGVFLGWAPSTVMEWAREHIYLEEMDDPDDLYYHESPQYWIMSLLISKAVGERVLGRDREVLKRRILEVFADERLYYDFPRGTDWRPFRERIDAILAEYGGRLPQVGSG